MFGRSLKYIVLVFINIIVVLFFYFSSNTQDESDPFDTEYVIGLLQNEEKFAKNIVQLNARLDAANQQLSQAQVQLEQTRNLIEKSEQKARLCESEKENLIGSSRLQVKQNLPGSSSSAYASCESEILEISIAKAQSASLENLVSELREKFAQTQEELIRKNQLLNQIQNKDDSELEQLRIEVNTLKRALSEPIAIETNFLSARYCSKPRFSSLICVQEFLVRPSFTKSPITRLAIKVLDPNGEVVAQGEFNSAKSQLYRLTMGRGVEVNSGAYKVEYQVDNQTLMSEPAVLEQ